MANTAALKSLLCCMDIRDALVGIDDSRAFHEIVLHDQIPERLQSYGS
jgi:hypothetical protein